MRWLALLFVACGPIEPPCVEGTVSCEARCLSVCRPDGWELLRCLPCGQSLVSAGAEWTTCRIEPEACAVAP